MKCLNFIGCMIVFALVGCKNQDFGNWDGWQKVKEDETFKYMLFETSDISDNKPLFIVFPGLGEGIESHISGCVKRYLEKTDTSGIIVAPYIDYTIDSGKYYLERCKNSIDNIEHDTSRVYLLGSSCGSVTLLEYGDMFDPAAMMLVVAGAYQATGGLPTTELPDPMVKHIWFLNGYDLSMFSKYGILFDGSVYVDPVRNLHFKKGNESTKLSLFEGRNHSNTYEVLKLNNEYLNWLVDQVR